ncbi:hypothetical protein BDP27DRAFT_1331686 [Rhodocollybia butyracea]|uniref:PB1 domain-containing protein n=1 Tax=Rhodocollybia butyracea TaxID=206335 RepID=A0A9P5PLY5_9AGAR|nr:hypothetical protein BDP27DRAFT_1331686 [Rhodocollybia butyracea]
MVSAIGVNVLKLNCPLKYQKVAQSFQASLAVYGDFLLDDTSPSVPELPRRLGLSSTRVPGHKCKGYRREEITFTPDAFKNTVVVYGEPSLNERCVLCGRVVTIEESLLVSPDVPPVKVKVHFHEDLFVVQLPWGIEYDEFVEKLGRKIRLCGPRRHDGPLRVRFKDEDGDIVTLGSTEDVQMAFEQYRLGGYVTLIVT